MVDEILCNSNGTLLHISTNRSCSQVQMKQIAKELLSGQLVNILNECSGVECLELNATVIWWDEA